MLLRPRSLAARLALSHGLLLLGLLAALWGGLYGRLHQLAHSADSPDLHAEPTGRTGPDATFLQVIGVGGDILYRSDNLRGQPPLPVDLPGKPQLTREGDTWAGRPIQVQYTPLMGDGGRLDRWVQVARLESPLHRQLHQSQQVMLIGIGATVLLTVLGGFLLARRALAPVSALTRAAQAAGSQDLSVRLPIDPARQDELTELAATFNTMLGQLDASFSRERRFTADAAHELMTPLTILRGAVDLALRRERPAEAYRQTLTDLQGDLARMTTVVQGLLGLARVEATAAGPSAEFDLTGLVANRVEALSPLAHSTNLQLSADLAPGLTVAGDERQLADAVTNLLENGLKYTQPGGRVTVGLVRRGNNGVLTVVDTGVGFDPVVGERLFERFFRADQPDVQTRSGSGLGLAIARTVALAHGGSLTAHSPGPGRGSTFTLTLPLASPA